MLCSWSVQPLVHMYIVIIGHQLILISSIWTISASFLIVLLWVCVPFIYTVANWVQM